MPLVTTGVALFEMPAEDGSAARFDRGHDAALSGRQRGGVLTIAVAVAAEDVRHLQLRAGHDARRQKYWGGAGVATGGTGRGSKSSGLDVAQTLLVAMRRYRAVVARLRWPSSS